MASLTLQFPTEDTLVPVTPRTTNDLPPEITGNAIWDQGESTRNPFTYWTTIRGRLTPVKFINNRWFILTFHQGSFHTRQGLLIAVNNVFGLRSYPEPPTTPAPPTSRAGFRFTPDDSSSSESSGESTATQQSFSDAQEIPTLHINTTQLQIEAPPTHSAENAPLFGAPPRDDPPETHPPNATT